MARVLHSREKWTADGEQITKYFCEFKCVIKISKQKIKHTLNNDEEIHEVKDIIKGVKTFYELADNKKIVKYHIRLRTYPH